MFGTGSSPLTRGKPFGLGGRVVPAGLIPAHAGKTSTTTAAAALIWAHPRSRGENSCHWLTFVSPTGSSPLTRGKRHRGRRRCYRDGLIPAHAGKTTGRNEERGAREAHPRSRGENSGR